MSEPTSGSPTIPKGTWAIDPSGTTITVIAKKLGLFSVPATLTIERGAVIVDGGGIDVHVAARADSYTSANAKRNEHVRSADFLDAPSHPEIVFRAVDRDAASSGGPVSGTVTVKGVETALRFDIAGLRIDGGTAGFSATGRIDRAAIGLDKLPSLVIGNTLELTLDVTANLKEH